MWDKHQIVEEPYDGKLSRTVLKPSWGSDAPAQVNYHTRLKCYIIIELKAKEFESEYIGKLNFYISAINELVRDEYDRPTIGILLCKGKDDYEVEFSLRDINKPIGVSSYTYNELPEDIRQALPDIQELKNQLNNFEHNNQQDIQ